MPPRPHAPRPRPTPSRRPRVAGLSPSAARPESTGGSGPEKPAAPRDPGRSVILVEERPGGPEGEDTGTGAGTSAGTGSETSAGADPETGAQPAVRQRRKRAVPLLAAALVLLVAAATFFAIADSRVRGTPSATNTALVDVGATAEAVGQLTDALQTVYSYDYTRLDANESAARAVITPEFGASFDQLFGQVRQLAPQQQAVVTATVVVAAVQRIEGDRAVIIAFLDQRATRAATGGQPAQATSAGRLTVTGQRVDGHWKIAGVESR